MDEAALHRVDQQRLELESSIAKLRKSLRHWQTLEIDYEGLREEIHLLPEDSSSEEQLQAARDFQPEVVDDKELLELFTSAQGKYRRPAKTEDVLVKRIDYVSRNVETVRKQLSDAEKKRNALLLVGDADYRDEAGLPLTEITEELDDSGEVISSKVQRPGADAPQLVDVLRKAGVTDLEDTDGTITKPDVKAKEPTLEVLSSDEEEAKTESRGDKKSSSIPGITSQAKSTVDDTRRSPSVTNSTTSSPPSESPIKEVAASLNPEDDEEEAALRREMLEYGMDEVGAIVAQLDLEEGGSEISFDEDDLNLELDSDLDVEDDDIYSDGSEDEKGMSKRPTISSKYRRQMEELEKKLGIKEFQNVGPAPAMPTEVQEQLDRPAPTEAARKAAIARHEAASKSVLKPREQTGTHNMDKKQKGKKKVAFAESLDIAQEDPSANKPPVEQLKTVEHTINPIAEAVVERSTTQNQLANTPVTPPKKISKFKSARSQTPQTPMLPPPIELPSRTTKAVPEGPEGKTISDELVERPSAKTAAVSAPDFDDFDEELHRREVAVEYYKMRNRKIHEQGGFVGEGEEDNYGDEFAAKPIEDEETGKTRKVSRFKAARLKS